MTAAAPEMLCLLLLAVPAVSWLVYQHGALFGLFRGIILTLLVLATTDPQIPGPPTAPFRIAVWDVSDSLPKEAQEAGWTALQAHAPFDAVVTVGRTAEAHVPAANNSPPLHQGPTDATDLAGALHLALGILGDDHSGDIWVYADGHSTTPIQSAVDRIIESNTTVTFLPLTPVLGPPRVRSATLPPSVAIGATAEATLTLDGGSTGWSGTLYVRPAKATPSTPPWSTHTVSVAPRETATVPVAVAVPAEEAPGPILLAVEGPPDPDPLLFSTLLEAPVRAHFLRGDRRDGAVLEGILRADGFYVSTGALDADTELSDIDLLVLAGAPAVGTGAIPLALQSEIEAFVNEGGGLLTLAGRGGYLDGGWHSAPFASTLPVVLDPDGAEKDDSVSLLFVLDKSGSMARNVSTAANVGAMMTDVTQLMVGGRAEGSKIRVAAEAAAATLQHLRDHDRVGVLAVDTQPWWPLPLTNASARTHAARDIRTIAAGGGGMYVVTAIQAAAKAIRAEDSPIRHILVLVDASDAGEKTRDNYGDLQSGVALASQMRAEGITLSVVGIGTADARDVPFLRSLAEAGGGRFQLTPDVRSLQALFAQEVEPLVGAAASEPTPVRPQSRRWHPALRGIDLRALPLVHGWSDALPRPTARVVLETPEGAPLLAVWNRGAGVAAAWTTDDGARWARDWPSWSSGPTFWVQLSRTLARDRTGQRNPMTLRPGPTGLLADLSSTDPAYNLPLALPSVSFQATVDGVPLELPPAVLSAPGVHSVSIDARPGSWVEIQETSTSTVPSPHAAAWVPSPLERAQTGENPENRAKLTHIGARDRRRPGPPQPLWPYLLAAAAVLLPIDSAFRRRALFRKAASRQSPKSGLQ